MRVKSSRPRKRELRALRKRGEGRVGSCGKQEASNVDQIPSTLKRLREKKVARNELRAVSSEQQSTVCVQQSASDESEHPDRE